MTGMCARMRTGSRSFSAVTEMSDEHWRLIFAEISCQAPARTFGYESSYTVQLTTVSTKASLKPVRIADTTGG